MKKILLLLLTAALLSACAAPPPAQESSSAEPDGDSGTAAVQEEILFLVDSSLDPAHLTAAENFAARVGELTGGELSIEVLTSAVAESYFLMGRSELAFLGGENTHIKSEYLKALSLPFLYPSYDVFSMAVNKDALLDILGEEVPGAVFLGGFYSPGEHLLSTWQPTNYLRFSDETLVVGAGSVSAHGFSLLGSVTAEAADVQERLRMLWEGEAQAGEFTLEELAQVDWTGTDFYFTYTYHSLYPRYLAAAPEFYAALTPPQKAAVQEAMAAMYGDIDQHFLNAEDRWEEQIRKQGVLISREFSAARAEIKEGIWDNENPATAAQAYVLELIDSLE